jgi:hypothetical protein
VRGELTGCQKSRHQLARILYPFRLGGANDARS